MLNRDSLGVYLILFVIYSQTLTEALFCIKETASPEVFFSYRETAFKIHGEAMVNL